VPSCSERVRTPEGADDGSDSKAMDRGHGGEVTGGMRFVKPAGALFLTL
jgi:hypothetical protein